jgi:GDPmannose 4,6-dehydratase
VRAQWLLLQQEAAEDYVIATGSQHSVREFVERAGEQLGMRVVWRGAGIDETGVDDVSGKTVVRVDPRYFRPTEVETLLGDSSKARAKLGWKPEISFADLVKEMVASDSEIARRDALVAREGFAVPRHYE